MALPNGQTYFCPDRRTLETWVIEGRVGPDAEVYDGAWYRLGDRADLAPFFKVRDRSRRMEASVDRSFRGPPSGPTRSDLEYEEVRTLAGNEPIAAQFFLSEDPLPVVTEDEAEAIARSWKRGRIARDVLAALSAAAVITLGAGGAMRLGETMRSEPAIAVADGDWLRQGELHLAAGKAEQALSAYALALEESPRSAAALVGMGLSRLALGDADVARELFEEAIEVDLRFSPAYIGHGRTLESAGDSRGAIAAYRKYLELDPWGAHAAEARSAIEALSGDVQKSPGLHM